MMRKLVALISTLLLAGCAALPTELDVQSGPELVSPTGQEFSYYSPASPSPGASSQEIVSGFLAAGTGPQNDYSIAREYLAEDFAQRWQPTGETLIRTGVPSFRESGDAVQLVQVNVGARVDSNGRYSDVSPATSTTLRFQLVREAGEWRIAAAPNLTVVTQPVFSVVFRAFPIYFVDNRSRFLVPDLRWFPSRASTPTRLVNALLAGPSDWLDGAVTSAIPTGTSLTINAVSIENGVARVDFDANALAADAAARPVILAQLRATLVQISGVNQVAVFVNDSPQDIQRSELPDTSTLGPTFALASDGIQRIALSDQAPLSGTGSLVQDYEPVRFALTDDGRKVGFSNDQGVFLLERDGISLRVSKLSETSEVAAMEFDGFGSLWVFPVDATAPVEILNVGGTNRLLASEHQGIRAWSAISPEGGRLVQGLITPEGKGKISVETISRDAGMIPLRTNPGYEFAPVVGSPISLTWHGANAIRVLEQTASGLSALSEYPLSGPRRPLTMPPVVGVQLLSGTSSISTYLLSEEGELWTLTGNTWRAGVRDVIALSGLR
jgi:hypothetical protein